MTTANNTTPINSLDASAVGRGSSNPFVVVFQPRDPGPSDIQYPIQKTWLNTVSNQFWFLKNFTTSSGTLSANWVLYSTGTIGVQTLSDTSGTLVSPTSAGNIQLSGASGQIDIVADPTDNSLVFSLAGGGEAIDSVAVDAHTSPGTNPVVPDTNGLITVTGGQVAAGTTTHTIQTNSLAANTYTIQVQRAGSATMSTVGDNGVCHFNSNQFSLDSNAYVSILPSALGGFDVNAHTSPGTSPVVPDSSGNVTITGGQVAAGTTVNVIRTDSLAANTYTIEIQRSQAAASSTVGDNGVSHFSSSQFSVDGNGFVELLGGGQAIDSVNVDANTGPGTNPVIPAVDGSITVTGGQVAAGTTSNVIQTDSLAANTYTIQIQRAGSATMSTVGDNGVCHFNSNQFSVDSNAFVSLVQGSLGGFDVDAHTSPGTSPVVPDSSGNVTITGGQVAAGTTSNVIQTNSLAANTYTIQIQRSQAVASSTAADNGVSHYDSGKFSVDSNGFVSLASGFYGTGTFTPALNFGGAATGITYSTQSGAYTKIGNVCFFLIQMILTSKGSASGNATITGLPFTSASSGPFAVSSVTGNQNLAGSVNLLQINNSATLGTLVYNNSGTYTVLTDSNFGSTPTLLSTGFYLTQ